MKDFTLKGDNEMLRQTKLYLGAILVLLWSGCMSASEHRAAVQDNSGDRVTVGTVQKEIKIGMPASDVAVVMGSPNIVTTDEKRREVWIYDKISTQVTISKDAGFGSLILLGYSRTSGASSQSQRTLTVIIKFDESNMVRDFAYHTSRF